MSTTFAKVQDIIADALYVEKDECERGASLMSDLGAESIDFLDIMFRLEKEFSIKIPKGEIETKARGGLSDDEFAVGGVIQAAGLKSLAVAMPEVDASLIKEGLNVRDIPSLFTVATFEKMVLDQLGLSDATEADVSAPALSQAGVRL